MASHKRKCRECLGSGHINVDGYLQPCSTCGGDGFISRPIKFKARIRIDNRPPKEFSVIVHPDGLLEFKEKGRRSAIATTIQGAFDLARKETAAEAIRQQRIESGRPAKVSRGLLATERHKR